MKKILLILFAAVLAVAACESKKPAADIEKKVDETLAQLSLQEKIKLIHAQSKFSSAGVPRLGIPTLWTSDGPHGIRADVLWDKWRQADHTDDSCTAFPALTCLAATWNTEMAALYGKSIGEEARYRHKDVLLAPGLNILRHPLGGRNFEYMGEDPYLTGRMAVNYIQAVQRNKVAVCVKHYALNNDEIHRHTANVVVDDRALYEIYLPAFKAAVQEGGAWSVMGSYNLYKDQHCCHNQYLLNDILKGEWGFDGAVISDWGGCHDTDQAITNGLDLEFGTGTNGLNVEAKNPYDKYYLALPYQRKIEAGEYGTDELDDKVRRVLRLMYRTSLAENRPNGSFTSPEHFAAARRIGAEGIVLLKNEGGLLPVKNAQNILVVGENAIKKLTVGGGSSSLKTVHEISPLQGIREAWPDAQIVYERGYVGDPGNVFDGVSTGQDLQETRTPDQLIADAVSAAAKADVVFFVGGLNKSKYQDAEDSDRASFGLPYGQDAVIEALADANPNLVVINISGNPVGMPWASKVPVILQDWYLGSEAGRSLADVLTGAVNPSGHLPFTIPYEMEDGPVTSESQYPGIPREDSNLLDEYYSEGVYVGYRWYDTQGTAPRFAFGHGLSYTTFEFGEPRLSAKTLAGAGFWPADVRSDTQTGKGLTITLSVRNTGNVAGAEVVQLYITDEEASVDRPAKELKGFAKVFLEPGQRADVSFHIDPRDLAFFDAEKHGWTAEAGTFMAQIGASSQDIRQAISFELK